MRTVFPYTKAVISISLISRFFSLSFVFRSLTEMCFCVHFFEFILIGMCAAFWICSFMCLATLWNSSAIIFSSAFSVLPLSLLLWGLVTQMFNLLSVPQIPWGSVHYFFQSFLLVIQIWSFLVFYSPVHWFGPVFPPFCCWAHALRFWHVILSVLKSVWFFFISFS